MVSLVNQVEMVDLVKPANLVKQAEKACRDQEDTPVVMVYKVHLDLLEELSTETTTVSRANFKVVLQINKNGNLMSQANKVRKVSQVATVHVVQRALPAKLVHPAPTVHVVKMVNLESEVYQENAATLAPWAVGRSPSTG